MHHSEKDNQQLEIVSIVDQICEMLIRNGRQPEVYINRWYDICVHSSSINEVAENGALYGAVKKLAGDYFGEFYWAHSIQHIYIWFNKEKKR